MRMKRFDRFWFSGLRFLLLNDFEAWVPHPCALRKGALFDSQHLGQEPTLSQPRERMGHPPLREKNLSRLKTKDQEGFFAQIRRSE